MLKKSIKKQGYQPPFAQLKRALENIYLSYHADDYSDEELYLADWRLLRRFLHQTCFTKFLVEEDDTKIIIHKFKGDN